MPCRRVSLYSFQSTHLTEEPFVFRAGRTKGQITHRQDGHGRPDLSGQDLPTPPFRRYRLSRKKRCMSALHSSSITPQTTSALGCSVLGA